jgi:hypothetical protein
MDLVIPIAFAQQNISRTKAAPQCVTKFLPLIVIDLVTHKAAAKL